MSDETDRRTVVRAAGLTGTDVPEGSGGGEGRDGKLRVTTLGTGASALTNGRANAGHVVHADGEPRFLLDAGGGIGARLAEAGIDLTAPEAVFLGHLHIDHTSDLPALVKAAWQQGRDQPLPIYGPSGTEQFPGIDAFLERLFDRKEGVYSYLPGFVERYTDGELALEARQIDATNRGDDADEVRTVREGDLTVEAVPETHGRIPTLAYRFTRGDRSITFSGDTNLETENLQMLADGSDVLVHNRLLDRDTDPAEPPAELHSYPEEIGETAQAADVGMLVLSHVSQDDRERIQRHLETIRSAYDGPIVVACDLATVGADGRVSTIEPNPNDVVVVESSN